MIRSVHPSMFNTHQWQKNLLYCVLIVLIGTLSYANSLHSPFIFDDEKFIVRNSSIHHLWDFHSFSFYVQRGLGMWTFALNYALGGLDVWGYHLFNILIHLSCGLFVWWFICLIIKTPEKEKLAFWAALLFVTHPIQTMAVNHITQRFVALAALFYMAGLSFYFKGRLSSGWRSGIFFIASMMAVLGGVFTRQSFVTFPAAVIMCEMFFLNSGGRPLITGFKRHYLIWIFFVLLAGIILSSYGFDMARIIFNAQHTSQSHLGETVTWFNYFLTQSRVLLIYIRLLFFPVGLNFDYDMSLSQSFLDPEVLVGFFFIIAILICAWQVRGRQPIISFGILWFFLTLCVESSIIPIPYVIAEYRLYLPLFGFCLSLVWLVQNFIKNHKFCTIFMGMIVFGCTFLTIQRNEVYKDEVTLWSDVVKKSPNRVGAYTNLAAAYIHQGQYQKALEILNKAIELGGTKDYKTLYDLAQVYALLGRENEAVNLYEKLLNIEATPWVYNNLGLIYEKRGDLDKAKDYFLKANQNGRGYQEIKLNLARVIWQEGDFQQAIILYSKVLVRFPQEDKAKYALAQLYVQVDDFPKAQKMADRILSSERNNPQELVKIGSVFAEKGHVDIAIALFKKAITVDENCLEAYLQAGKIFGNFNKFDSAISIWQLGLYYSPGDKRFEDLIDQARRLKLEFSKQ